MFSMVEFNVDICIIDLEQSSGVIRSMRLPLVFLRLCHTLTKSYNELPVLRSHTMIESYNEAVIQQSYDD